MAITFTAIAPITFRALRTVCTPEAPCPACPPVPGTVTAYCCADCHDSVGYCNKCHDLGDACCAHTPECDACNEERALDNFYNPL